MRRRVLRVRLPPRARTTMTTTAPRRLVEETVVLVWATLENWSVLTGEE